jgi:DNA (cytosine-5)-methyltransferase 1
MLVHPLLLGPVQNPSHAPGRSAPGKLRGFMAKNAASIPVIDLFAGCGGLGEGFSRYAEFSGDDFNYTVRLSIEKEPAAVQTLQLRAFFRQFREGCVPEAYYDYIRSTDPSEKERLIAELQSRPEWRRAIVEVWKKTLGASGDGAFFKLHQRIKRRINGAERWVLLGGPPCQAYSVVGRARRLGGESDLRLDLSEAELRQRKLARNDLFFRDEKHTLYTEYLEIVALHQPPIFVMENVKGILSSKLPAEHEGARSTEKIFNRIVKDLADPWQAIGDEKLPKGWEAVADKAVVNGAPRGYALYSFSEPPRQLSGDNEPGDYLIKAELHGVPQERHRVILLGVREDIDAVPWPLKPREHKVSVQQVIGHLPPLRSGRSGRAKGSRRNKKVDSFETWADAVGSAVSEGAVRAIESDHLRKRLKEVQSTLPRNLTRGGAFIPWDRKGASGDELERWLSDGRLNGVIQHETREHMDEDFGRYIFAAVYAELFKSSPKLRHFPEELLPNHKSVYKAGLEAVRSTTFADRFRVQVAERPSTTIMAHIRRDGHYYIHYDPHQCRSLTVREAARLQTFPDNYHFSGNRTEQYEQIGNAVPPYLAVQLAEVVARTFEQAARKKYYRRALASVLPAYA